MATAPAETKVSLGSILAGRRIAARLRQLDLAEKMGLTEDRISNIENDRAPVTVQMFKDWCVQCKADPARVIQEVPE